MLLLIPQRYEFSSKSQLISTKGVPKTSCCWYHKGTNFQANHNFQPCMLEFLSVVADTTKVRIFKQITTVDDNFTIQCSCCWYHKGTNFQANHNWNWCTWLRANVVADTTKVRIFKQITTKNVLQVMSNMLLLIPQRYEFSSKSQLDTCRELWQYGCCWYHKGTNFQANHNEAWR